MRILVVDDDPVSLMLLEAALRQFGHHVISVRNGSDAWERVQIESPDVVIADWMMPELDGLELCRRIRSSPSPSYVYAILLTSRSDTADRVEGLRAGADDFITKPLDRGELAARLSVAERILRVESALRATNAALEEARRHELEIGAHIQTELLQSPVPAPNGFFQFAALSVPSRFVDGDFFEFFVHDPSRVDVLVGDAMGKGVPAALLGAGTKHAILRAMGSLLARNEELPTIDRIVNRAHSELAGRLMKLDSFVTLALVRFDASASQASLVDCGHTMLLHYRASTGQIDPWKGKGNFPLGFSTDEVFEVTEIPYEDGDVFLFSSDGVTDALSPEGEAYGEARLEAFLAQNADLPPKQFVQRLRAEVSQFSNGASFTDDFTCIAVKIGRSNGMWTELFEEVPSDLSSLRPLREFVGFYGRQCGLNEAAAHELELAVFEACTNVVRHAHRHLPGRSIRCHLTRLETGIQVELRYEGEPFLPEGVAEPDLDNLQGSGLGLFLIRALVNRIVYGRIGETNTILMEKHQSS